jgi:hypothetical protein
MISGRRNYLFSWSGWSRGWRKRRIRHDWIGPEKGEMAGWCNCLEAIGKIVISPPNSW